jgi:hypothetical protein
MQHCDLWSPLLRGVSNVMSFKYNVLIPLNYLSDALRGKADAFK